VIVMETCELLCLDLERGRALLERVEAIAV
jgi:hypothetical protein